MGANLLEKMRERRVPLVAFIELTNRCNLDCVHCMRPKSSKGELTRGEFENIISELSRLGCLNLSFTGGEPLLHEDFFDLADYAKGKNYNIKISSNGTLIDEKVIPLLKKLQSALVQISLYGATSEVHDPITRIPGSHRRTLSAIRLLTANAIRVQVHMPVMKQNFSEFSRVRYLAAKEGWKFSSDFVIYPGYDGSMNPIENRITDEQLATARRRHYFDQEDFIRPRKAAGDFCNRHDLATVSCRISSLGEVFPSGTVRLKMGNLREGSFHDIWFDSDTARRLRGISESDYECSGCREFERCSWDIGLALAEEGKVTSTPNEWCRFVKKERKP